MDEANYLRLADEAFSTIVDAFEDVDPDVVDCEMAGDVVTLTMPGKKKCVVNTQRPTRQIWLAAAARAWHFSYEEGTGRWMDDKSSGEDLYTVLARVVLEGAGVDVTFSPA
jgi:CyaY protein